MPMSWRSWRTGYVASRASLLVGIHACVLHSQNETGVNIRGRLTMIKNIDADGVKQKIDSETGGNEAVKAIYGHIVNSPGSYDVNPEAGGLEFMSTTEVRGFPNRCRMKIWQPEPEKLMAWFYKPSAVHFSRDRYSLGGVVLETSKVDSGNIGSITDEWLKWLDSGLDPARRPADWESAFPYDIPA